MSKSPTVSECWNAIAEYIGSEFPELAPALGPGRTAAEVADLEQAFHRQLPGDFKELLLAGSAGAPAGIIPDPQRLGRGYNHAFKLMTTPEIVDQWQMLTGLFDGGEFDDRHAGVTGGEGVVKLWWSPGWIPFADNGGGDYYCVDLVPTYPGRRGQVVFFCHETSHRPLIAPSTAVFMSELASAMQSGAYELSPRGTVGLVRKADAAFPDAGDD